MERAKCGNCLQAGETLLVCVGCRSETYCSQSCQKNHWKDHRQNCKCFKIQKTETKGFGLVASRGIKQGELILQEDPVLLLKKEGKQCTAGHLTNQFNKLQKHIQERILSLHDENPTGDQQKRLRRIFESNAIDVNSEKAAALYLTIPRINHSCAPNVIWGPSKDKPLSKEVRAVMNIQSGEEILANYTDSWQSSFLNQTQRQKLLERWNFLCCCAVCSLPEPQLTTNNDIRRRILIQHALVPKYMTSWEVMKALDCAKEKLSLSLKIEDQILASLPSTYLEVYELLRTAQEMGFEVEPTEPYLSQALRLSTTFGYSFLTAYHSKVKSVEEQCSGITKRKRK